jgi:antitoxin component YwqK of YwqJK toxin-antitoxin module
MRRFFSLLLSAILVLCILMGTLTSCSNGNSSTVDTNEAKYTEALALIETGQYEAAYAAFKALGDYKDSQKHLARFIYFPTVVLYDLDDRSGILTVMLGEHNLPARLISDGILGRKDSKYTYDSEGNLMKQDVTHNGESFVFDYTHDANNQMTKAVYSVNGVATSVHDFTYDAKGQLIKEVYTVENVIQYDCDNFYDDNGNRIRSEFKTPDADYVYTYTYNADGNVTNEHCEDTTGYFYTVVSTYDADGKLTKTAYTDVDMQYTVDYTYDNAGNCIKEECVNTDGSKEVLVKEYDAYGNVTKEVYTDANGEVQTIESYYALTYRTVDVPASTMNLIMPILTIANAS